MPSAVVYQSRDYTVRSLDHGRGCSVARAGREPVTYTGDDADAFRDRWRALASEYPDATTDEILDTIIAD